MNREPMRNRVILITGVGGGIGKATVELFLAQGWNVAGVDKKSVVQLHEQSLFIHADCAEPAEISFAVQAVSKTWGRIDVLVNNAGVQINKPAIETNVDDWDYSLAVNLRAAFLFAKECHNLLKKSSGNIVNVSSVHAISTSINVAAYAAAKGGLVSLTRALAIEWAMDKIRVNAVLPGAVDTPMLREGLDRGHLAGENVDEQMQALARKTVLGRIAQPQEIAQAILFLADQSRSSFMTGQALVVDGGATIKLSTE